MSITKNVIYKRNINLCDMKIIRYIFFLVFAFSSLSSFSNHIISSDLSSGFLVNVGCQRIAIETPDKLIYMLTKYLTDPTKFESEWYSKDVINKLDNIK